MARSHQRLVAEALLKAEKKYDELKKIDNKIIYDLSHKLEAIKNVLKEPDKDTGSAAPLDMAGVINDLHKKLSKIEEILEAEG